MRINMAVPKKRKVLKKKTAKLKPVKKDKKNIGKKKSTKKVTKKTAPKKIQKKLKNKKVPTKKVLRKKLVLKNKKKVPVSVKRFEGNPIVEPRQYPWESKATFNPAAFESNGKVHLVYRAIGDDDSSALGYAGSLDGYTVSERPTNFIYRRGNNFSRPDYSVSSIDYVSGGGWNGGCEDPRLTKIGDRVFMIYTAFDGWGSLRLALTSIALSDFENKRWKWKPSVMISPPGEIHKNWVVFPEKINEKFAVLHSVYPKIMVDYFDSLDELNGTKFIKSNNTRPVDISRGWDSWFRGVGPSPIKTELGWLILYHAMDHKNPDRYRIGALILDSNNPTKILYRSQYPILEPEEWYENNGYKWGVVYSCGAVVKDGNLLVYYGGADKVIAVGSIKLAELLDDLKKNKIVKLDKSRVQ